MEKHIRCNICRFVRRDPKASDPFWATYECGNPGSEFYRALLNITPAGDQEERVSWNGCPQGERGCV